MRSRNFVNDESSVTSSPAAPGDTAPAAPTAPMTFHGCAGDSAPGPLCPTSPSPVRRQPIGASALGFGAHPSEQW
ncbi:hypothetical protein GCM10009647_036850 [Streptomyces sanglieri]